MDSQRSVLLQEDSERNFFKNIRAYKNKDKPLPFDVRSLYPGKTDVERANLLADHFNAISAEFSPLDVSDIPVGGRREVENLQPYQVAGRIRGFRKPKSMVQGDLFPKLVTRAADFLAVPLCDIYS